MLEKECFVEEKDPNQISVQTADDSKLDQIEVT